MPREDEDDLKDKKDELKAPANPEVDGEEYALDEPEARESEDDDEPETRDETEAPKSRQQKRAERGKLFKENARLDAENRAMAERLARIEGQLSERSHSAPVKDEVDPIDEKLEQVRRRAQGVVETYNALSAAGKLTPEKQEELRKEAERLEDERVDLKFEKRMKASQRPEDPRQRAQREMLGQLQARYPDIMSNPTAREYAYSMHKMRIAREGRSADTMEAFDEVVERTRDELNLRPSRQPSKNTRDAFSSPSRGASAPAASAPRTYKFTEMDAKMAEKRFPHITDIKKRHQTYVDKVIKPMLDKQKKTA